MPVGGKLVLKGGTSLGGGGVKKKHKKKKAAAAPAEGGEGGDGGEQQPEDEQLPVVPGSKPPPKVDAAAINVMTGKTYEQEFDLEQQRMAAPKVKNTPWGSSYRAAPEILHGYDRKVTGKNASERLDMRAATKADKFCK